MGNRVNYSGLVIAGIGFFLTRFTVTLALYETPVRFYFAGIVPLVLGLGLAAFGVALAVAEIEPGFVRTTATWCVIGAATMLVLVVLTLFASTEGGAPDLMSVRSQAYLSNFLIGGSIGGTLTGMYAARSRRQRWALRRQADRLEVLNRMLRHEILNAVTAIRGYVGRLEGGEDAAARRVIDESAITIERAVDEVKYLASDATESDRRRRTVDLVARLESAIQAVTSRHPSATIEADLPEEELRVIADEHLDRVFVNLLENAVLYSPEDGIVRIEVTVRDRTVAVMIGDQGPGLPESQRSLLERGEIQPFDDPDTGFGLNVVRFLVDDFGATVRTDVDRDGSTIEIEFVREKADGIDTRPLPSDLAAIRPALPHLLVTLAAAIVAGVAYGAVSEAFGGSVAGIGVFYGAASPVVGWITHEFHSVVFGFVFAGLISVAPRRYRRSPLGYLGIGMLWAGTLWLLAAGVVAPIWLRLLGIPAPIPNLSSMLLAAHLVWGITLGACTYLGYTHVVPALADTRFGSIPRFVRR